MENMKKRFRREKEDWFKYSNETLIKEILPIMDNLERAVSHSTRRNRSPLPEGRDRIDTSQLEKRLEQVRHRGSEGGRRDF